MVIQEIIIPQPGELQRLRETIKKGVKVELPSLPLNDVEHALVMIEPILKILAKENELCLQGGIVLKLAGLGLGLDYDTEDIDFLVSLESIARLNEVLKDYLLREIAPDEEDEKFQIENIGKYRSAAWGLLVVQAKDEKGQTQFYRVGEIVAETYMKILLTNAQGVSEPEEVLAYKRVKGHELIETAFAEDERNGTVALDTVIMHDNKTKVLAVPPDQAFIKRSLAAGTDPSKKEMKRVEEAEKIIRAHAKERKKQGASRVINLSRPKH